MKNNVFKKVENILIFLLPVIVLICGIQAKDNIWAIVCSIFSILYTLLAGKGLIVCYPFGIIGTLICGALSFNIGLFGNAALHIIYYFPLEIYGFFNWRKHLKKNSNEIIKEKLDKKYKILLYTSIIILSSIFALIFKYFKNPSPILDSSVLVLSCFGMFLNVRRYIEQWSIWTFVNIISIFLWFEIFLKGEGVFSIFVVRIIYLIMGIYFYFRWKNDLKND